MQSVLDLPNLSTWYARPRLPWEQFSKCKVAYVYEKATGSPEMGCFYRFDSDRQKYAN